MQKTHANKSNIFIRHKTTARVMLFACMLLSLILSPVVYAADQKTGNLDYQVKAAMVYKFLSYAEWPAASFPTDTTPYRIWVLGTNIMSDELIATVSGRTMNGRPIEVYSADKPSQIIDPHLIFVVKDMEAALPQLAVTAERDAVMVVTENEQGLEAGSTINLRLVNGRIGFDVSLKCAQKNNLKLSARLLSVASSVDEGSHK